jgi:hypothetical protein
MVLSIKSDNKALENLISRHHASIATPANGGEPTLTDLSTNGCEVDGKGVAKGSSVILSDGAVVIFGCRGISNEVSKKAFVYVVCAPDGAMTTQSAAAGHLTSVAEGSAPSSHPNVPHVSSRPPPGAPPPPGSISSTPPPGAPLPPGVAKSASESPHVSSKPPPGAPPPPGHISSTPPPGAPQPQVVAQQSMETKDQEGGRSGPGAAAPAARASDTDGATKITTADTLPGSTVSGHPMAADTQRAQALQAAATAKGGSTAAAAATGAATVAATGGAAAGSSAPVASGASLGSSAGASPATATAGAADARAESKKDTSDAGKKAPDGATTTQSSAAGASTKEEEAAATKMQSVQRGRKGRAKAEKTEKASKAKKTGQAGAAAAAVPKEEPATPTFEGASKPGQLRVVVLRARGVAAADKGGTSDPYTKLSVMVGKKKHASKETKVMQKTLNPWWHEAFTIEGVSDDATTKVVFEVVDKNKGIMAADAPLGQVEMTLGDMKAQGMGSDGSLQPLKPLPLQATKKQKLQAGGTLEVLVGWIPPSISAKEAAAATKMQSMERGRKARKEVGAKGKASVGTDKKTAAEAAAAKKVAAEGAHGKQGKDVPATAAAATAAAATDAAATGGAQAGSSVKGDSAGAAAAATGAATVTASGVASGAVLSNGISKGAGIAALGSASATTGVAAGVASTVGASTGTAVAPIASGSSVAKSAGSGVTAAAGTGSAAAGCLAGGVAASMTSSGGHSKEIAEASDPSIAAAPLSDQKKPGRVSFSPTTRTSPSTKPTLKRANTKMGVSGSSDSVADTKQFEPTKKAGQLRVVVLRARGVAAADEDGSSDPYVKVKVRQGGKEQKFKTDVCYKTLDPAWNTVINVENVSSRDTSLLFEVFDEDKIAKGGSDNVDDPLGQVELTLQDLLDQGLTRDGKWLETGSLLAVHPLMLKTQAGERSVRKPRTKPQGALSLLVGWVGKEEAAAATKMQSLQRGRKVRKDATVSKPKAMPAPPLARAESSFHDAAEWYYMGTDKQQ